MWSKYRKYIIGLITFIAITSITISVLAKTVFSVEVVKVISIEAGSNPPNLSEFFIEDQPSAEFITDISSIPIDKPGVHEIKLKIKNKEYHSTLEIVDTVPPKGEAVNYEIWSEEVKQPDDFVMNVVDMTDVKISFKVQPDYSKSGDQLVPIILRDTSDNTTVINATLTIKADKERPVIKGMKNQTIYIGESISYKEEVTVTDNRDEHIEIEIDHSGVNLEEAGEYQVFYRAVDSAGNKASTTATITILADTEPPSIKGVKNQTIFIGNNLSYKRGVTVTDNRDKQVALTIDNSEVNLKQKGQYPVIYRAVDLAGNIASTTATITVKEKPQKKLDPEELNNIADKVLRNIIKDGMSDVEKTWAIYKWVTNHISYTGYSDKSDWKKGALRGLKKATGDCYNYYATSRILLTRSGFEHQTVIREGGTRTTRHYWNLIKVNGSWYHFDTTPTINPYTGFLRTDNELRERSKVLKDYYSFDETKHPSTPEEPLDERSKYIK